MRYFLPYVEGLASNLKNIPLVDAGDWKFATLHITCNGADGAVVPIPTFPFGKLTELIVFPDRSTCIQFTGTVYASFQI